MSVVSAPGWTCNVVATVKDTNAVQPITANMSDNHLINVTAGSSSGQVNKAYTTTLSLNHTSASTIDLQSLTDRLGTSLSLSTIEAIKVTLGSTTAGEDVTIGGGTNAVFDAITTVLKAGSGRSVFFVATPITVDSTHHVLQLAAAAGTAVSVTVTIIGR